MRKIIAFALLLFFAFSTISLSEEAIASIQPYLESLSSMDFESLLALSVAVNTELVSRPESHPIVLSEGMYLVGTDIAPGIYYFTSPDPVQSGGAYIYTSKTTFENREAQPGSVPGFVCSVSVNTRNTERIILESGNLIQVWRPIVICSDKESAENYFIYTPPEGTYVPAGIYTVGTDIPEGIYRFYSATGYEAEIEIYEHGKWIEKLEATSEYETFRLLKDYEIKVIDDIIMTKQPSLNFD